MKIKSIKINNLDKPKDFYDITVDKHHNFVIGKSSKIVTHNSSLNSAVIAMAQKFKNSMPLLDGIGQYGSLRSPEAGAPRYISTKLHPNFRLLYKDFDLLTSLYEEGHQIEPKYFLPIIPTVLLNGSSGIAVGFATNILNRNPIELIDCCLKELDGRKFKEPTPQINGFTGECVPNPEKPNAWIFKGKYDIKNTTTVHITELPPSQTYEKFDDHLNKLEGEKDIASYDNNCKKDINYTVKMPRSELASLSKRNRVSQFLKMEERQTENFTVLDETGKLKIFNNATEIIKYFVKFRLNYYDTRKKHLIAKIQRELMIISNRARFIKMIIDGKLKINNVLKRTIEIALVAAKFDLADSTYTYLLSMPIHNLTKEKYRELLLAESENKKELVLTKKIKPMDMYVEDLNELKKVLKKNISNEGH